MPLNFVTATQAPVVVHIDGRPVEFPTLDIGDHKLLCAHLTAESEADAARLIPRDTPAAERFAILRPVQAQKASLDDVGAMVFTPEGAFRVLALSFAKAGGKIGRKVDGKQEPDDLTPLLRPIPPHEVINLAIRVSNLWPERNLPAVKEGEDPAAVAKTFADSVGADPLQSPQSPAPVTFAAAGTGV